MIYLQMLAIAVFVAVHVFASRLRFLDVTPRSRWLSFAGGISVAYVFVHVFPELAEAQSVLGGSGEHTPEESVRGESPNGGGETWDFEHQAYLVAMAGLVVFYGLERYVKGSGAAGTGEGPGSGGRDAAAVFRLHVAMFALYNALIGYLLVHRVEQDTRGLALFAFAYALHFVVNDHALSRHHSERYRHLGRWLLAGAVLCGWLVGLAVEFSEHVVHVLFALLAGATILNVMKEELPEERESRFLPFVTGAAGYAVLMLAL